MLFRNQVREMLDGNDRKGKRRKKYYLCLFPCELPWTSDKYLATGKYLDVQESLTKVSSSATLPWRSSRLRLESQVMTVQREDEVADE